MADKGMRFTVRKGGRKIRNDRGPQTDDGKKMTADGRRQTAEDEDGQQSAVGGRDEPRKPFRQAQGPEQSRGAVRGRALDKK